jgi:hypothetical protein
LKGCCTVVSGARFGEIGQEKADRPNNPPPSQPT